MARNVTISADRQHMLAWGYDQERGLYLDVYANTPFVGDGRPAHGWDERSGLTPDMAYGIAMAYGVEDVLWRTLDVLEWLDKDCPERE